MYSLSGLCPSQPSCHMAGMVPTSFVRPCGHPPLGQGQSPAQAQSLAALTSGSALTLHSCHARLMTVAAACSCWTCFRVSQERTAEGFVQKQETRVNMPVRALGKPGYTSARAAVNVGMNAGSHVRSGTESTGRGPGSEKQRSDLQADAYCQGKLPPPTLGNAQGTRGI